MGSLLYLVKTSEAFYTVFFRLCHTMYFLCTINKETKSLPTVTKALTLQFTFLLPKSNLFHENLNRSSNCCYLSNLNMISEFCYIWRKYPQQKAFMFEAKSSCGSLFLSHKPPMEENFWFQIASLLCKVLLWRCPF